MCLILFAYQAHPVYRLILAANRDEYYARPSQPAHWWPAPEQIVGGRDLHAGGSWLALDRQCRLAAVTNVRNPADMVPNALSRGRLVVDFLAGTESAAAAAKRHVQSREYAGFNLLLLDRDGLWSSSNRGAAQQLLPGCHGLSNAWIDAPWPKVVRGRERLAALLQDGEIVPEKLLALLADAERAADEELPDTGIGREWERLLSSIFIRSSSYGTRASTVVLQRYDGSSLLVERRFGSDGVLEGEVRCPVSPS